MKLRIKHILKVEAGDRFLFWKEKSEYCCYVDGVVLVVLGSNYWHWKEDNI